jgi:hypothetical protein
MSLESSSTLQRSRVFGVIGVVSILLVYTALYAANFSLPLENLNLTSRIWNWSQTALTVTAILVILLNWKRITFHPVLIGLVLGIISAISHWQHDPYIFWCAQEGLGVLFCFVAGVLLFKNRQVAVSAFDGTPIFQLKNAGMGILFALPLAALNNLYFYLNSGSVQFKPLLASALEALSPAIHEEIIFRFFILALVLYLLRYHLPDRRVTAVAVFLAVIPHSLNHLPELFLQNPLMGLVMLIATSLLFGLPMALLQIKKDLGSAIAFHWFIDFARFWFGF